MNILLFRSDKFFLENNLNKQIKSDFSEHISSSAVSCPTLKRQYHHNHLFRDSRRMTIVECEEKTSHLCKVMRYLAKLTSLSAKFHCVKFGEHLI